VSLAEPCRVTYRVRFDECGPDGGLRRSGLLRYAQDAAWVHSDGAGFGRDWYAERRLTGLVRSIELHVAERPVYGERLAVTTEIVGWRRVWARRRTTVERDDGARVADALTDWVLIGPRGQPVRVPEEIRSHFPSEVPLFHPQRIAASAAPPGAQRREFEVRDAELDPMAHVNHAVYLDYFEADLRAAGAGTALDDSGPVRFHLDYAASAEPGDRLAGTAWRDGQGWAYTLASLRSGDLLRARFEAQPDGRRS
jgi:acyl-ACP thioesterase